MQRSGASAAPTVSAFISDRLDRQHDRAGHQPQHDEGQPDEEGDRERQPRADRRLLVDELGGVAADARRRTAPASARIASHDVLGDRAGGSPAAVASSCQVPRAERARRRDDALDARRRARRGGERGDLGRRSPSGAEMATATGALAAPPRAASASATVRALWPFGITEESIADQVVLSAGSGEREHDDAPSAARRRPGAASRRARGGTSGPPSARRARRGGRAWRPTARRAPGEIDERRRAAATTATVAPAMPIDFRKPCGKTVERDQRARDGRGRERRRCGRRWPSWRAIAAARRRRARELLAVARDEEQRVVDREAEAEPDHEVEREDAQAVDLVDPREHEERARARS